MIRFALLFVVSVVVVLKPSRGKQKKNTETLSTFFLNSKETRCSRQKTRETRAEKEIGREKGKGRETREKERARVQQLSFFLFGNVFGKS